MQEIGIKSCVLETFADIENKNNLAPIFLKTNKPFYSLKF
jgi:hypothetical protein